MILQLSMIVRILFKLCLKRFHVENSDIKKCLKIWKVKAIPRAAKKKARFQKTSYGPQNL